MWNVFLESKTWRRTPSELFGIDDQYVSFCLNEAVAMIGNWITHELEKVEGKNAKAIEARREQILKRLLAGGEAARFQAPIPTQ